MTTRRVRVAGVLLKQKHPLIATRLLLPGLFLGLIGSVSLVYSYNHSRYAALAASTANITVTNTSSGTIQTQLSTNLVTWAPLNSTTGAQTKFNALHPPLTRLHIGDDGIPTMPEIRQNQWANNINGYTESRPFEFLDELVSEVYAAGQEPLMNIKFAPDWMWACYPNSIGINGTQGTGAVTDLTFNTFAQYMARLVDYYNNGSMTTEQGATVTNPSGTAHRITYWELWNEPDLNNETPCAPSNGFGLTYQQYTTMWNAVTTAMLAKDPSLKFVGPATAGSQFGSSQTTGNQYVDYLMTHATTMPTALSFHGYGYWDNTVSDHWVFDGDNSDPSSSCCGGITDFVHGVDSIHSTYPSLPIWLTEVNVNADWGNDAHKRPWSEFAAAWWGAMFAQAAPINVGIIHQYDALDDVQFGLININNGNTFIAYQVFALLNQYFPQGSTLLSATSDTANVLTLAAKLPSGHISVLVVNRQLASNTVLSSCGAGGVPVTVTVNLSGITAASATLQQIDKTNVNCTTNTGSAPTAQTVNVAQPLTATFPGYGIAVYDITPASATANIWVDTTGGTCTRSATPSAYSDAAACGNIQAAMAACSPGDTIIMKAGSYGPQTISANKSAPGCSLTAEDNTITGAISTAGSWYTLDNLTVDVGSGHGPGGWGNSASNITLKNVRFHGPYVELFLTGGSNVTWQGGELGQAGLTGGKRVCGEDAGPLLIQSTDHVTIDDIDFHPQDYDPTPSACSSNGTHLEMVRIDHDASFITLKNSIFDNGDHSNTSSIFITNVNVDPGDPHDLTFENNFFGSAENTTFGLHTNVQTCLNFTWAYNTFENTTGDPTCTYSGSSWVGNLGARPAYYSCKGTHTKNVWQDQQSYVCGSDAIVIGTRFGFSALGLGGSDGFHLQSGSPAIDAAETPAASDYCTDTTTVDSVDIDGDTRPQGVACDAGADEYTLGGGGSTDTTAPTVSISAPAGSAKIRSTTTVSANATDNVGVSSVQFKLDGVNLGSADTTSPYSVSWNTTTATNGSHTLTAVAADAAGNTTTAANVTVTVDNSAPIVAMTAPAGGATVSGSSVLVSANATDNTGVAGVQFYLDYAGNPASNKLGAEDTTAPYSFTWDTTTLGNGSHTLMAIARDAAGNTTNAATVTVTVNNASPPPPDTTAPSVPTNLHATATTTSSISLAWNAASDNVGGSGLAGYDLYRNGSYLTTIVGSTSYTNTGLSAATNYSYQIKAIDNASNASSLSSALSVATQANASPPPVTYKKGDCNHDNAVNIYDLSILLSHYNSNYSNADFDSNSIVNVIDLSILLSNYGG